MILDVRNQIIEYACFQDLKTWLKLRIIDKSYLGYISDKFFVYKIFMFIDQCYLEHYKICKYFNICWNIILKYGCKTIPFSEDKESIILYRSNGLKKLNRDGEINHMGINCIYTHMYHNLELDFICTMNAHLAQRKLCLMELIGKICHKTIGFSNFNSIEQVLMQFGILHLSVEKIDFFIDSNENRCLLVCNILLWLFCIKLYMNLQKLNINCKLEFIRQLNGPPSLILRISKYENFKPIWEFQDRIRKIQKDYNNRITFYKHVVLCREYWPHYIIKLTLESNSNIDLKLLEEFKSYSTQEELEEFEKEITNSSLLTTDKKQRLLKK